MSSKKSTCSDFILAAIRRLRQNSTCLTPGTAGGVGLQRLFPLLCEIYPRQEAEKHINLLIKGESLVLVYNSPLMGVPREKLPKLPLKLVSGENHRYHLYIKADGLPRKVTKMSNRRKIAEEILASL